MFSIQKFLFEAPVDAWLKRHGSEGVDTNELNTLADSFKRFSAVIYNPDITQYNSLNHLKTIIQTVELAKKFLLKGNAIKWLTKMLFKAPNITVENVKEDYIPLVRQYDRVRDPNKPVLDTFTSVVQLSDYLDNLQKDSSAPVSHTEEDLDIFWQDDEWMLAMPHTTEASCELGKGTTWCTARTNGQNLFLSYLGSNNGIILFYAIKKGGNPRSNPWDKVSIGFINGEPKFNQGEGNITVNAANNNVTEGQFENLVGVDRAEIMVQEMTKKAQATPIHPAQQEMNTVVGDINSYNRKLQSFKDEDAKIDFALLALKNPQVNPAVFNAAYSFAEEREGTYSNVDIKEELYKLNKTVANPDILDILIEQHYNDKLLYNEYLAPKNFTTLFRKIAKISPNPIRDIFYVMDISNFQTFNPTTKSKLMDYLVTLIGPALSNDKHIFRKLENSKEQGLFPQSIQRLFMNSANESIVQDLAFKTQDLGIMAEIAEKYQQHPFILAWLGMNSKLPQEIYMQLLKLASKDPNTEDSGISELLGVLLTRKTKVPKSYLDLYSQSTNAGVRKIALDQLAKGMYVQEGKRLLTNLLFC